MKGTREIKEAKGAVGKTSDDVSTGWDNGKGCACVVMKGGKCVRLLCDACDPPIVHKSDSHASLIGNSKRSSFNALSTSSCNGGIDWRDCHHWVFFFFAEIWISGLKRPGVPVVGGSAEGMTESAFWFAVLRNAYCVLEYSSTP